MCGRGCERVKVCGFVELQCARKEEKELSRIAAFSSAGLFTALARLPGRCALVPRGSGTSELDPIGQGRGAAFHPIFKIQPVRRRDKHPAARHREPSVVLLELPTDFVPRPTKNYPLRGHDPLLSLQGFIPF